MARGRPRLIHLGHLLPYSRQDQEWRHRRRSLRQLSPLARGHCSDEAARPQVIPVLGRVAADPATGRGPANQAGLDYYSRLTDGLLEAGIRPLPTLYHWDLPQALEDDGGWPNRDTADRFADYSRIVAGALSDRIDNWVLFNEPKTFTQLGYLYGAHAPGRKDPLAFLRATHVVNLAQGKAFRALKEIKSSLQVGGAFDVSPMLPATDSAEDRAAAVTADALLNLWYLQPALTGQYPVGVLPMDRQVELLGFHPDDEAILRAPSILSASTTTRVSGCPMLLEAAASRGSICGPRGQSFLAGPHGKTDIGWDIYPRGLHEILVRMRQITGDIPIEITENGCAYNTGPGSDGRIRDDARIAYMQKPSEGVAPRDRGRCPGPGVSSLEPAWTTSSGLKAIPSVLVSCLSTSSRTRSGQSRTPVIGTPRWLRPIGSGERVEIR